jgi:pyridoxamine 5'-phosphate oxidase
MGGMTAETSQTPLSVLLRSLPVFAGPLAEFDPESAPDQPDALFVTWLGEAVAAEVPEPHAMTLSTCDAAGVPDARVLILKDLDAAGWWFATSSASAKGRQLDQRPAAALTFYWPLIGRQVRVRGTVVRASAERSAADFRARSEGARAIALAGRESAPLESRAECAAAVEQSRARLAEHPDLVSEHWTRYAVAPDQVEFWQADKDREHTRVLYRRTPDGWARELLWP